jgi:hypothetical protein
MKPCAEMCPRSNNLILNSHAAVDSIHGLFGLGLTEISSDGRTCRHGRSRQPSIARRSMRSPNGIDIDDLICESRPWSWGVVSSAERSLVEEEADVQRVGPLYPRRQTWDSLCNWMNPSATQNDVIRKIHVDYLPDVVNRIVRLL